jgi:radical SAM superfamily enzyme YgiQ (UPF0313 family)
MRVLLVHAEFPRTYWGFQYAIEIAGKGASLPPLGLVTLAALLPRDLTLRLVDLNVEPLADHDLAWADVVMAGGMLVQADSMRDVIARARRLGRKTVVGGPAAMSAPELFDEADVVFQGEAEGRIDDLLAAIAAPTRQVVRADPCARPSMDTSVVPRWDLVRLDRYVSMAVQMSRGCPYSCEFCDVIEMFGRVPRVKEPDRLLAELDALYAAGWRGSVFVVDDNFIGSIKHARRLLPDLVRWQAEHGHPFELYTEASMNLAAEDDLLADMAAAGFTSVFVGIETPSKSTLRAVGKTQNLRMDLAAAVDRITRAGLEVMGGFIVGFDGDDERTFEAQRDFLRDAPIPLAMVGLLTALPGTALWRRLAREGRLRSRSAGEPFERPNFLPTMEEASLLRSYTALLEELYSEEGYLRRARAVLARRTTPTMKRGLRRGWARFLARAVWRLGVVGERRRLFWTLLALAAMRSARDLDWAVVHALQAEHFIRYTREDVVPRLRCAIREIEANEATEARAELAPPSRQAAGIA